MCTTIREDNSVFSFDYGTIRRFSVSKIGIPQRINYFVGIGIRFGFEYFRYKWDWGNRSRWGWGRGSIIPFG